MIDPKTHSSHLENFIFHHKTNPIYPHLERGKPGLKHAELILSISTCASLRFIGGTGHLKLRDSSTGARSALVGGGYVPENGLPCTPVSIAGPSEGTQSLSLQPVGWCECDSSPW